MKYTTYVSMYEDLYLYYKHFVNEQVYIALTKRCAILMCDYSSFYCITNSFGSIRHSLLQEASNKYNECVFLFILHH
jgi:hypothetical protein